MPMKTSPRFSPSDLSRVLKLAKRSEEHTSELQSRLHLVCRLLLEKNNIRWRKSARDSYRARDTPPHLYLWEIIPQLRHRCFVGSLDQPDFCLRPAKQPKPGYES